MKDIVRRGTVLHRMFETTIPPKSKFFVVVGESETHLVGFFFVNSGINQYVQRNQAYFDMQMSIKQSIYQFLKYDSFIGAHELKMIDKSILMTELKTGKTTIKGYLTREDMEMLLNAVRNSQLFSKVEKDTFFK